MTPPEPPAPSVQAPRATTVSPRLGRDRFVSVNIPNLHYIEDEWTFDAPDRFRLPTEFEVRDALAAVKQLGANVVRIYALSVRKRTDPGARLRHVLGPGEFDERAFVALDRVLQVAGELGVRVIVPFVDNWQHWGGVPDYAAFRGRPAEAFWSDEQLIADFERTVAFVLSRKNVLTGRAYREDPAVYAWETGNELQAPYAWTARIAAFIKAHDALHPVIDGFHSDSVRDEAIDDPNIDLLTTHHYASADDTVRAITRNVARIAGRKPYFVGEFGLIQPAEVGQVLGAVIARDVLGALIWSLRFHREQGGFYWHAEKDVYESYRWPGFASGDPYGERAVLALLRRANGAARGDATDVSIAAPPAPTLLPIASVAAISWRGSTGASTYGVERASTPAGPWAEVASGVDDARFPYRPLWSDASAVLGATYFYRVVAANRAGSSAPSNVVGPIVPDRLTYVDELDGRSDARTLSAGIELTHDEPKHFRMDRTRARATGDGLVGYRLPGGVSEVRIFAFEPHEEVGASKLEGSRDGVTFFPLAGLATDYQWQDALETFHPVLYRATPPRGVDRVRVRLPRNAQLGRVELDYRPAPPR